MIRKTFVAIAASLMTLTAFGATVTVMAFGTATQAHVV